MRTFDNYSLKNASLKFKTATTLWLLFGFMLIGWIWFISLNVVAWYRFELSGVNRFGDGLVDLFWSKFGLFATLLGLQVLAYAVLWFVSKRLLERSALRRRVKKAVSLLCSLLVFLNLAAWLTLPFFKWAASWVGTLGVFSSLILILMPLPALWQMWFYKRWKNAGKGPKRVVIVGGGFAGLYAALGLDKALGYHSQLEITVIDQKNFFLFPPLLPSAAVGTIEAPQVTYPFRRIFETTNIFFKKGTVVSVDTKEKQVHLRVHIQDDGTLGPAEVMEQHIAYDYLVLAPGSTTQTFNTKGVEENALFVRELEDAIKIRNRIIDCFERAACSTSEAVQRELLRFAVVGGGPTGIETATEIQDLIHEVLLKRYPEIHPSWPEVSIIQSGPQILPGWPDDVVRRTTDQLKRLGVKLILNTRVIEVKPNEVLLKEGHSVQARTCLWCAGVQPSPLVAVCCLPLDKSGRVAISEDLRVPGFPEIFVLGDAAHLMDKKTQKPLPPLGQVAFQQGSHTAKNLVRLLAGKPAKPFRYFNFGALVSVGEHYAAVNLLGVKISGFLGWIIWRTLYLSKIIGINNRIRIMVDWTLDLLIERSITQVRSGDEIKATAKDIKQMPSQKPENISKDLSALPPKG